MSQKKNHVTNVCTFTTINNAVNSTGGWTLSGGYPLMPDEIIIRQVTYMGDGANKSTALLMISSNMTQNQFIGSICNIPGFTSNPGTVITPTSPMPQVITFQLQAPTNIPLPVSPDTGDMITLHSIFCL